LTLPQNVDDHETALLLLARNVLPIFSILSLASPWAAEAKFRKFCPESGRQWGASHTNKPSATPSTSGHRLVVGTHNPRTGKPTQWSWGLLSLESPRPPFRTAQRMNIGQSFRKRAVSFQADCMFWELALVGALGQPLTVTRWSKQIREHEARQK